MAHVPKLFGQVRTARQRFSKADAAVLIALVVLICVGLRLALGAPARVSGPDISLSPTALPFYAGYSVGRMLAAYALSMLFALTYGYLAAYHRQAEQVLMPLLDVLQSVPILSFLPVVLLSLSALLPENLAVEVASIVLIFTSQVWNLTFSWYQSLTTIPRELREAARVFRFGAWMRLRSLELPFGMNSLIWNSMMSWAGGWFFLMAAETFTVGERDFRLPGLGAYLQEAARQGDLAAIAWGLASLVLVIVALDQFAWRPLLAWSGRFTLEMVARDSAPSAWFLDLLRSSRLAHVFACRLIRPTTGRLDRWLGRRFSLAGPERGSTRLPGGACFLGLALALGLAYGTYLAAAALLKVPLAEWTRVGVGLLATLLRVLVALAIALTWTIPAGLAIGTKERLARWLQPLVQIMASIPATALFPVFLLVLLQLPGGLNLAAVLLMLMGMQWYLLFNVIAGASAIPEDLNHTAALLQLSRRQRWRVLFLPALFPYVITGAITAAGGAWNASIVAEYVTLGGRSMSTTGIGAIIAEATAAGNYNLLLAATLSMVLSVVIINRLIWSRLYRLAEEHYRME